MVKDLMVRDPPQRQSHPQTQLLPVQLVLAAQQSWSLLKSHLFSHYFLASVVVLSFQHLWLYLMQKNCLPLELFQQLHH
jgi:hypothetical protein